MTLPLEEINDNPLYQTLGIRITEVSTDRAVSQMRPPSAVCWPRAQPHGGIVFTQLDTTMATAVLSVFDTFAPCATISVDIQYTNPARGDLFVCTARVERRGNKVSFARAETRAGDGTLIALAQGTFRTFDAR